MYFSEKVFIFMPKLVSLTFVDLYCHEERMLQFLITSLKELVTLVTWWLEVISTSSLLVRLGVDFVLPLSLQQEQQEQEPLLVILSKFFMFLIWMIFSNLNFVHKKLFHLDKLRPQFLGFIGIGRWDLRFQVIKFFIEMTLNNIYFVFNFTIFWLAATTSTLQLCTIVTMKLCNFSTLNFATLLICNIANLQFCNIATLQDCLKDKLDLPAGLTSWTDQLD